MKTNETRKIAIYTRKSRFTGKGDSIESQISYCKDLALRAYPNIKEEDILLFRDEGYTGKNTSRPEFQRMLKLCKTKQIKHIFFYKIDRVSRKSIDFLNLYEFLKKQGTDIASVKDNIDTSTPAGIAMMQMCAVFAELERNNISERVRDTMMKLAQDGRWLGGETPTGYMSEMQSRTDDNGKVRKKYKLAVKQDEVYIVKTIFQTYLKTKSITQTVAYLNQNRIPTKNNREFRTYSVREILSNPVYLAGDLKAWDYFNRLGAELHQYKEKFDGSCGFMIYNKTSKGETRNEPNPIEQWIISLGEHEPLISSSDWIKVQELLEKNKSKSFYQRDRSIHALLSGIIRCGSCGDFMRPKTLRSIDEDGNKKFYYLCQTKSKTKSQNCNCKNPPGNYIDKLVCDEVEKLSIDSTVFNQELESAKIRLNDGNQELADIIEHLENKKEELDNEISSLIMSSAKVTSVSSDYFDREIIKLDKQIKEIDEDLSEKLSLRSEQMLFDNEITKMQNKLKSFSSVFNGLDIKGKRDFLKTLIERIIWKEDKIEIYFFDSHKGEIDFDEIAITTEESQKNQPVETTPMNRGCKRITDDAENEEEIFQRSVFV